MLLAPPCFVFDVLAPAQWPLWLEALQMGMRPTLALWTSSLCGDLAPIWLQADSN
jgi:hypothetical protein